MDKFTCETCKFSTICKYRSVVEDAVKRKRGANLAGETAKIQLLCCVLHSDFEVKKVNLR